MERGGAVYILTNHSNTTMYVGVTSELSERVHDHKTHRYPRSFTARYKVHKLVYYEAYHSIEEAIAREKQLKAGSRKKKQALINAFNPEWRDLYDDLE
ncbi:MAG: GIY-YIG nuclease family protein [Bacteroidota bacterium]